MTWKIRYCAVQCHRRTTKNENPPGPKANLVEDNVIAAVVSQTMVMANVNYLVVDFGATRHICANQNVFASSTFLGDEEEQVYLDD